MELWWPKAKRDAFKDGGTFTGGPFRGVLHTTEGSSYAGARSVYAKSSVAPHFTIGLEGAWQHVPLNRASRALPNLAGGVETNRQSAVQVEVVHRAGEPWPDELVPRVRELMEWVEAQTGVQPWAPPFLGSQAYGLKGLARMTTSSWLTFPAWCGHQHVPESSHWDPGPVPIDALLERRGAPPVADIPKLNYPARCIAVRPQGDGYWLVAYDGGVFAFGAAPALPGIGGDPVERIVDAEAWPDGEGLLCLGEDGGVFALGSAQYHGRVENPA